MFIIASMSLKCIEVDLYHYSYLGVLFKYGSIYLQTAYVGNLPCFISISLKCMVLSSL